ncbi:MAG: hypothetical protein AAGI11_15185 [Pseudomonadota bacterium]
MEIPESDGGATFLLEGIPTIMLGIGGIKVADTFALDGSFAGVGLAFCGGDAEPKDAGPRAVRENEFILQLISANAEGLQLLINRLEAAKGRLQGGEAPGQALSLVARERHRQVHHYRFDAEHDDVVNDQGDLISAAVAYVLHAGYAVTGGENPMDDVPDGWPWDAMWWRPSTPQRSLVKAIALLMAELERQMRLSSTDKEAAEL